MFFVRSRKEQNNPSCAEESAPAVTRCSHNTLKAPIIKNHLNVPSVMFQC